ncbi:MAG: riboflavin biosynthesis protein RibF [Lentisphaeria bacterium]|nr:riboflavin biosynthesis protein RibF [Lentisphaeria bacterium]
MAVWYESPRTRCGHARFTHNPLFSMDGIARSLSEVSARSGTHRFSVAIGVFDGIHRGHRQVIETLCAAARENGSAPLVVTFSPHPREVLAPDRAPQLLTTPAQQRRILQEMGCADVVFLPFSRELAALTPREFLTRHICCPGIEVALVCVGSDWRFGRGGSGTSGALAALGREFGFEVAPVRELTFYGRPVSSTRIREAVSAGRLAFAARLLGRPYSIEGVVARGRGQGGQTFSCPTANIADSRILLPPHGVYAARAVLDARHCLTLPGIVYVGTAPTVVTDAPPLVELHLFDFDENLYGRRVEVQFEAFLRPDRVFPSSAALRDQIARDVEEARNRLSLVTN